MTPARAAQPRCIEATRIDDRLERAAVLGGLVGDFADVEHRGDDREPYPGEEQHG